MVDDDVRLEIFHAELGKYIIVLEKARPVDADEYHLEQMGFATLRHFESGGGQRVSLARHTIFGPVSVTYDIDALYVERSPIQAAPGTCKVCAGTIFQLRMSSSMQVEAQGEGELLWDGSDLELHNVLVLLTCAACHTPHANASMGSLRGMTLNGHALGRSGDKVSLEQLRSLSKLKPS